MLAMVRREANKLRRTEEIPPRNAFGIGQNPGLEGDEELVGNLVGTATVLTFKK